MFSKAFFPRGVESWDCVVKGEYSPCRLHMPITLSLTTNFRLFQLKEFADDFKIVENGGKFDRTENAVGRVEIARHEQFLLFPQCFQKTCTADT